MKIDQTLLKELQQYRKRDKVFQWLKKYKKYIILFFLIITFSLTFYGLYSVYINYKANKSYEIFTEIQKSIASGDNEKTDILLNKLIEEGTVGYSFLAYTTKVDLLLEEDKLEEAANTLRKASVNLSLPKYYTDMLSSLEIVIKLNNNHNQDLLQLETEIQNNLREDDYFYFHNLEMYASVLFMLEKYDESIQSYNLIIESEQAPLDIRQRAQRAQSTIISLK